MSIPSKEYYYVEKFLEKYYDTDNGYDIDPRANQIPYPGGGGKSMGQMFSEVLEMYQNQKAFSAVGVPMSLTVNSALNVITKLRSEGFIIDKEDLRNQIKKTENRIAKYEEENRKLKEDNDKLRKMIATLNQKHELLKQKYDKIQRQHDRSAGG